MTNPYHQPRGNTSTTTSRFNSNGHWPTVRPSPTPYFSHAMNDTLNQIIEGDPHRVTRRGFALAEMRAPDEATAREIRAEYGAKLRQLHAEKLEQERRQTRSRRLYSQTEHDALLVHRHEFLRGMGVQPNAAMDSKATFDAWYSVENKLCGPSSQRSNARAPQAPAPAPAPAPEPEARCGFDHCDGFCAGIRNS